MSAPVKNPRCGVFSSVGLGRPGPVDHPGVRRHPFLAGDHRPDEIAPYQTIQGDDGQYMDEDGHLQPLAKNSWISSMRWVPERPVFGHDPAGGGADKAGQQQQYHQGPQRILTGVVGVAPLIVP